MADRERTRPRWPKLVGAFGHFEHHVYFGEVDPLASLQLLRTDL